MFRGTSSSDFMSIGMITSLEMNILLDMTRKSTICLRLNLFVPIMSFLIQLQVAPPHQLVTGAEDLTYPGPVEPGVVRDGFLYSGSLCPAFASIHVFILRVIG